MAMIKNCTLFFPKLDPKRPNSRFNKENPTWEVQIRTTDKTQKAEWEALGLPVKLCEGKEEDGGGFYYRVNLKKRSITSKKEPAKPVEVINGHLEAVDPCSIANGSVGHIRIFQYEYPVDQENPAAGTKTAAMLMAIQLKKHIVYVPGPRDDDFDVEETETIEPEPVPEGEEGNTQAAPSDAPEPSTSSAMPSTAAPGLAGDKHSDDEF